MKQPPTAPYSIYERPTKPEWAVFAITLLAFAIVGLVILSGCTSGLTPGETKAEAQLDTVEARQLSAASASVDAAKQANAANPTGAPKTAVEGELGVAAANLPMAQPQDTKEALSRINAALSGQLAEAQKEWSEAVVRGNTLNAQLVDLQKEVVIERATATAIQRKATNRLCVIAALLVGGALFLLAALSLSAGLYLSLTKLEYGAAGLGLCGSVAFFAATQVGTAHFNVLAFTIILGAVGALMYIVVSGFEAGCSLQTKAAGFDCAIAAVRKLAGEVATDAETSAKNLWHWLEAEFDAAHKALVSDWQKLETQFNPKPINDTKPTATPAVTATQN